MKTFFDSSAFAKRYVEEKGSQIVDDICQETTELSLSVICVPEILSALNRRIREKCLSQRDYARIKQYLSDDIRDAMIIHLIPEVIAVSTKLLEASPLRAMDALHVACAIVWRADLFVSSDKQQVAAARKAGLKIKYV
ncbi:MAG: type II toxin-antitoxin system VapC family toxin [Nitrospirae bacterium]|nr:type II toxin-antitoxin system VapC family toxin [Nitrospirota bacterium]